MAGHQGRHLGLRFNNDQCQKVIHIQQMVQITADCMQPLNTEAAHKLEIDGIQITSRQPDTERGRQTGRQTDRQTGRQTV